MELNYAAEHQEWVEVEVSLPLEAVFYSEGVCREPSRCANP